MNYDFAKKYNNEKEIPIYSNEFIEWFEKNRINIANLNISNEEKS